MHYDAIAEFAPNLLVGVTDEIDALAKVLLAAKRISGAIFNLRDVVVTWSVSGSGTDLRTAIELDAGPMTDFVTKSYGEQNKSFSLVIWSAVHEGGEILYNADTLPKEKAVASELNISTGALRRAVNLIGDVCVNRHLSDDWPGFTRFRLIAYDKFFNIEALSKEFGELTNSINAFNLLIGLAKKGIWEFEDPIIKGALDIIRSASYLSEDGRVNGGVELVLYLEKHFPTPEEEATSFVGSAFSNSGKGDETRRTFGKLDKRLNEKVEKLAGRIESEDQDDEGDNSSLEKVKDAIVVSGITNYGISVVDVDMDEPDLTLVQQGIKLAEAHVLKLSILARGKKPSTVGSRFSGNRLHTPSLWKVGANDPRIFKKEGSASVVTIPDIVIVIDESGSMSPLRENTIKTCAAMYYLLKKSGAANVWVYFHTTKGENVLIKRVITPKFPDVNRIAGYLPTASNADGFAALGIFEDFLRISSSEQKVCFWICDSEPAAYGYGGTPAIEHTRNAMEFYSRIISVLGIEIGDSDNSSKIFRNFVRCHHVESTFPIVVKAMLSSFGKKKFRYI